MLGIIIDTTYIGTFSCQFLPPNNSKLATTINSGIYMATLFKTTANNLTNIKDTSP